MSAPTRGAAGALVGGLDALLRRAVQLVWLNLWWTLFTLRGGILLGIGPATVGAHAVASAWARGEREVDVRGTMSACWHRHRRLAAPAGLLALALTASLALTWWLSRGQAPIPAAITQGLVLLAALLLAATLPYLALVIERTDGRGAPLTRTSHLFAAGLALGMSRPVLTLALMTIWIGWPVLLLASGWPGLLPVLGVAIPLAASARCLERVLPRSASAPPRFPPTDTDHDHQTDTDTDSDHAPHPMHVSERTS
ncbi:hypothetical protein CFK41_02725 [Brachybacterium ginsengisoli]|uniref:DUF624 domain-containing protein n=1 Tax=Brachybacterium ginsengisoli TaxID=1331682 RepID=A0A291GUB1_9MICO|nr:DUF624 domain-containing protein [Brachybacterium ginsengisoli]ATG53813.1 hypothetical protein CFK41_02725 [Brachybacterium ginsengisoli]